MKRVCSHVFYAFILFLVRFCTLGAVSFPEGYTVIKELRRGEFCNLYLCESSLGEQVGIESYLFSNLSSAESAKSLGMAPFEFVGHLIQVAHDIGSRIDHPNIAKIQNITVRPQAAFVILKVCESADFYLPSQYTPERRRDFMRQLISALQHLFLRNIMVYHLLPENMIIENGRLTLTGLGNMCVLHDSEEVFLHKTYKMIAEALVAVGGDQAFKLLESSHARFQYEPNEKLSWKNIRKLVLWLESLQEELSVPLEIDNTISIDQLANVVKAQSQLQKLHRDCHSFCTAQNSDLLLYSFFARYAVAKFSPGKCYEPFLINTHLLRYPFVDLPTSFSELFAQFPLANDFDIAFPLVARALVSANPSLNEREPHESAWAIFMANDRMGDLRSYLNGIFDEEKVSPIHYEEIIEVLIKASPKSHEGIIYNFFIPKNAPVYRALYPSKPYGIPMGDLLGQETLESFFILYEMGRLPEPVAQLRFLPSALTEHNQFPLEKIKSYRITTIPNDKIWDFAKKVRDAVDLIYEEHLEEMLSLAELAAQAAEEKNGDFREMMYENLCYRHALRRDSRLAFYYWHKLSACNARKNCLLSVILLSLIVQNQVDEALTWYERYKDVLAIREQLTVRLAMQYIQRGNRPMLDRMLKEIRDSGLKSFVYNWSARRFQEYADRAKTDAVKAPDSDKDLFQSLSPFYHDLQVHKSCQ